MANTIVLKGKGHYIEGEAAEAVTPGMPVQLLSDNTWGMWDGAAAGEHDLVAIAVEDALQGKTITDAYADGDRMQIYIPVSGDVVNVRLKASENVSIGEKLIREDNTGLYIATTGTPEVEDFVALEASNVASAVHIKAMKI
jgi:hypothetical protein